MEKFICAVMIVLCSAVIPLQAREWQNRKGKRVEGDFVKLEDNIVHIRRTKDREVIRISISNLIDEDQLYVMDTVEERNAAAKAAEEEAKRKAALGDDDDDGKKTGDDEKTRDSGKKGEDRKKGDAGAKPDNGVVTIDGQSAPKGGIPIGAAGVMAGGIAFLIAIVVLGLISLAGWIWLLVVALKCGGCLWALVCFFCSPIGAIIFAVQHWEEAKLPFMMYIIPTALMVVIQILMGLVFG